MAKSIEKLQAQRYRSKGMGISAIARSLHVSKSSVSYWCRDIELSDKQLAKVQEKQSKAGIKALLKFAEQKRKQRKNKDAQLLLEGINLVGAISSRDLFISGLALYWAEGYKRGNEELGFVNSDPNMTLLFIKWLKEVFNIKEKDLILRVSINKLFERQEKQILLYWSKVASIPITQFTKTSIVKTLHKKKYRDKSSYKGTLRIKVRRGADLRKKILGAINALSNLGNK